MKKYLICFALAASMSAFGQGRGHGGAGGLGGNSMGAGPTSAPSTHGTLRDVDTNAPSGNEHAGKKSPDRLLTHDPKLASKLDSMLPKGTTAQQACSGFKNLGQCVAAIHVSKNLGISFDDLKAKMTGDKTESLGQSIHDLKPDANVKNEEAKAKKQAKENLSAAAS